MNVKSKHQTGNSFGAGYSGYFSSGNKYIFYCLNFNFNFLSSGKNVLITSISSNPVQFAFFDFDSWKLYKTERPDISISLIENICFTNLLSDKFFLVDDGKALVFACEDYNKKYTRYGYFYLNKTSANIPITFDSVENIVKKFPRDLVIQENGTKQENKNERKDNSYAKAIENREKEDEKANKPNDIMIDGKKIKVYKAYQTPYGQAILASADNKSFIYLADNAVDKYKWKYDFSNNLDVSSCSTNYDNTGLYVPVLSSDNRGALSFLDLETGKITANNIFPANISKNNSGQLSAGPYFVIGDKAVIIYDEKDKKTYLFYKGD